MSTLEEYLAQEQWRPWDAMLDRLPIESGQIILDLGCGPGTVAARLAKRGAVPIGVDQDATFLEAGRRRCPATCLFKQGNLVDLKSLDLPTADGLWSSFAAAYFPDFAPILRHWATQVAPEGWIALVEVDDILSGHAPMPPDILCSLAAFESSMLAEGHYDFHMGRRLGEYCRAADLTVLAEESWPDPELAFDGPASPAIVDAWERRFKRMTGMKAFLGEQRYNEVVRCFLETIACDDHTATASVRMVVAKRK